MTIAGAASVCIIANRQSSVSQGHNLLAYYLGLSSWKTAGWRDSLWQRLVVKILRIRRRFRKLDPSQVYHVFLVNWSNRRFRPRPVLLHVIWGDVIIDFINRTSHCIVTLHQPYELWSELRWKKISTCAGIICMAERECLEIRRRCPQVSCVFIPHGIDVNFWRPLPGPPKRQVCAIGRYLRNFEMLLRVARVLLDRHPELVFRWVINPDFNFPPALNSKLPPERFEIVRNLSATALHRLCAESWLFYTPYQNVVASNAIVESMASGTPVFTTRVGGMSSYAGNGAVTMVENDDDNAMIDAITRCLASPELQADLAQRGRLYAEKHFSWPVVVAAHEAFYAQVWKTRDDAAPHNSRSGAAVPVAEPERNRTS